MFCSDSDFPANSHKSKFVVSSAFGSDKILSERFERESFVSKESKSISSDFS